MAAKVTYAITMSAEDAETVRAEARRHGVTVYDVLGGWVSRTAALARTQSWLRHFEECSGCPECVTVLAHRGGCGGRLQHRGVMMYCSACRRYVPDEEVEVADG